MGLRSSRQRPGPLRQSLRRLRPDIVAANSASAVVSSARRSRPSSLTSLSDKVGGIQRLGQSMIGPIRLQVAISGHPAGVFAGGHADPQRADHVRRARRPRSGVHAPRQRGRDP